MALAVVLIHLNPTVVAVGDADFPLLSPSGIYNVTAICLSHVLTSVAVPTFFLISGYLFFLNVREFDFGQYKKKIKSRLRTLVLPYVIWNFIPALSNIFVIIATALLHGNYDALSYIPDNLNPVKILWTGSLWNTECVNFFGMPYPSTGPLDLPLWFVRDLIVMVAISPVVYLIVRYARIWGLALMFICLYFKIWISIPGLSITALFYFSTGAYFGIFKKSIVRTVFPLRYVIYAMALPLLLVCIYYDGRFTETGSLFMPIWVLTGVAFFYLVASEGVRRRGWRANRFLVSSCFFVYALHGDFIFSYYGDSIQIFYNINRKIFTGADALSSCAVYFSTFIGVIAFCLGLYAVMKRFMPRVLALLTGGR